MMAGTIVVALLTFFFYCVCVCVVSHLLDDTHALLLDISLAVGRTMASYILFFYITRLNYIDYI